MPVSAGVGNAIRESLEETLQPVFRQMQRLYRPPTEVPAEISALRFQRACTRLVDALGLRGTVRVPHVVLRDLKACAMRWAERGLPGEFPELDRLELEFTRSRELLEAEESDDEERILAVLERNYCDRLVEDFCSVELKGLPISHRVRTSVERVYVPLSLHRGDVFPLSRPEGLEDSYAPDRVHNLPPRLNTPVPVEQALDENRVLLLTGEPGSGKTTLVQHLTRRFAEKEASIAGKPHLPLVLLARALAPAALERRKVRALLNLEERLLRSVRAGRPALLMVDGLDEAAPELRHILLGRLRSLLREIPKLRLLLTGRPNCEPKDADAAWSDAARFSLASLSDEEAKRCIQRWCQAAEESVTDNLVEARSLAEEAARDLIQRMERSNPVRRIATNPLLCTILCMVHRFSGQRIPERRFALYERCTNVLLYDWDHARLPEGAILGKLDAEQKRALLRAVAGDYQQLHAAVLPREQVLAAFEDTLPRLSISAANAATILDEIKDRSGMLVEQRPGYFAFAHLTFQEYFAALDIAARRDIDGLLKHLEEPWWEEVFALSAAALGAEAGHLVERLLKVRGDRATMLSAMCVNAATELHADLRERVLVRVRTMIPPRTREQNSALAAAGMAIAPNLLTALRKWTTTYEPMTATHPPNYDRKDWEWALASVVKILSDLRYEPAVPLLAELAESVPGLLRLREFVLPNVGVGAWMGLVRFAGTSIMARALAIGLARKFRRSIASRDFRVFLMVEVPEDCPIRPELDRILTGASGSSRSSSSPKPSRRTASARQDKAHPAR